MAIILRDDAKVLIQGITGHQGSFHTASMLKFGTNIVAGVVPGRGGERVEGIQVFETCKQAVRKTGAEASVVFVPSKWAMDAVIEALDAGIETIVIITEHIPIRDFIILFRYAKLKGARIVGPNSPGIASPGRWKLGIMPNVIFKHGSTGVVSRSGTLTYEIVNNLTEAGIGQSTCVGIGGDPIVGTDFIEVLELFQEDPETENIVLIGEIGGTAEEDAADFIAKRVTKPVVGYIAGRTAPTGKRMGHAGAIISRGRGSANSKVSALLEAGVRVAKTPAEVPRLVKDAARY
ncbi:MAG: succinate--CoA ligase subunit alpha [Methanomassiliicoccales archaeon]